MSLGVAAVTFWTFTAPELSARHFSSEGFTQGLLDKIQPFNTQLQDKRSEDFTPRRVLMTRLRCCSCNNKESGPFEPIKKSNVEHNSRKNVVFNIISAFCVKERTHFISANIFQMVMVCMQALCRTEGDWWTCVALCSLCCLAILRRAFPWATKTIGRSSDITSFSMWMKCTLRAEAVGGGEGKKGFRRNCVFHSHRCLVRVRG